MAQFIAKYVGPCVACETPVQPGDMATFTERQSHHGKGSVTHVVCPDPDEAPSATVAYDKPTKYAGTTLEEMGY